MGTHKVVVDLVAKGQQAAGEFKKVGQAADEMGTKVSTGGRLANLATSALQNPLRTVGILLSAEAAAVTVSVAAYTNYAGKVREVQRVSGTTAQQASGLTYAFEKLGIGASTGAAAIFQLERRAGDGKLSLEKFGTSVKRTSDGSLDLVGTLGNIADAYQRTQDPARRAALLMNAFGRQGKTLIPILAQGRDGIKNLFDEAGRTNHLLDQGDLDRAKEFTLAVRELGQTFDGLKIKLGNALTPALTQLTETGTSLVQIADQAGVFDVMAQGAKGWADALTSPVAIVRAWTDELGLTSNKVNINKAAQDQYNRALQNYTTIAGEGNAKTREGKAAAAELARAKRVLTGVENQYLTATGQTQAATDALAQKSDTYKSAIEGVSAARDAEKSGEQDAITSAKALADAYDKVTAAKEREASAISGAVGGIITIGQAQDRLNTDLLKGADTLTIQSDAWSLVNARTDQWAATQQAATGHAVTAQEKLDYQRKALEELAGQYPQTGAAIDPLRLQMQWLIDHSDIKPQVNVNTGDSLTRLQEVQQWLAGLNGQTAYIHVRGDTVWSNGNGGGVVTKGPDIGQIVSGKAAGGPVMPNSTYLVGERGPELLRLGSMGGSVTPNHALGGTSITINAQMLTPTPEAAKTLARLLNQYTGTHGASGLRRN